MKKYSIKYQDGNDLKELILETSNISNEILPQNIISIKEYKKSLNLDFFRKKRINEKKLNFLFYELNLMLQANINISDALDILIKNKKDNTILEFLKAIKYSLSNGKAIDENLSSFNLNHIVLSFLKISQNNGNITSNMKALSQLLLENQQIKKNFIKSISYPIILIVSFFISLISIFTFVIPKFKMIFEQSMNDLPLATKVLLQTQYIFENYSFLLFLGIVTFIGFFVFFYKYNDNFEYFIHRILVDKLFLIKDIYLNMQLYKLFLVIDIMLKSNYEFHKAFISCKNFIKKQISIG